MNEQFVSAAILTCLGLVVGLAFGAVMYRRKRGYTAGTRTALVAVALALVGYGVLHEGPVGAGHIALLVVVAAVLIAGLVKANRLADPDKQENSLVREDSVPLKEEPKRRDQ